MCYSAKPINSLRRSTRYYWDAYMSKKVLNVDWKSLQGAAVKKRILKLSKNNEGIFVCPVTACLHLAFNL